MLCGELKFITENLETDFNHSSDEKRENLRPYEQLYGYMTLNNLRYGFIKNGKVIRCMKRVENVSSKDKSKILISEPIRFDELMADGFNFFKCAQVALTLVAANYVPDGNGEMESDWMRGTPGEYYRPSVIFQKSEVGEEPRHIAYLTGDNCSAYGSHSASAYLIDIDDKMRSQYFRKVENIYKQRLRIKRKPVKEAKEAEYRNENKNMLFCFLKLASLIDQQDFEEANNSDEEDMFNEEHADDGWFKMENELRSYKRLDGCPAVIELFGHGIMEFFKVLIFEKGNRIDDASVLKWCMRETERDAFSGKVRYLVNTLHSKGVTHESIEFDNLIWFPADEVGHYELKLVDLEYSKRYDKIELQDNDKKNDIDGIEAIKSRLDAVVRRLAQKMGKTELGGQIIDEPGANDKTEDNDGIDAVVSEISEAADVAQRRQENRAGSPLHHFI